MEPNKMEKDFKEKLEQRTIQPSEMAWDRLDAMLSVAENKKPKRNRTWMYMAAAFLVFLLVGVLFLNQEKENTGIETNNSFVTTDNEQPIINNGETGNAIAPVASENEVVAVQTVPSGVKQNQNKKDQPYTLNKIISNDNSKTSQVVIQDAVAENNKKEAVPVIQVNDPEQLLAGTVTTQASKKKSAVKVDANSLLSSVEEELDDSFKDRVLIATVKNIKALQSTVANRNYQ